MRYDVLKLEKHHAWRAKPGCKILVINQGELRLEYPQEWVIAVDPDCLRIRDREPPDDRCTFGVSVLRLPGLDESGAPLATLVEAAVADDQRRPTERGPFHSYLRAGLEAAWIEFAFVDAVERRKALARLGLAREKAARVQALMSLEFWPEDRDWVAPFWESVLESLELGRFIADPTMGPVIH